MVLRPVAPRRAAPRGGGAVPAWPVVETTQRQPAEEFWLITQPDHAALAGNIAAALGPPLFEPLAPEIVRGITLHDEGWAALDREPPARPMSFLDASVEQFVVAWTGSIEKAQEAGPLAGAIVSRHFCRLGASRLESGADPEPAAELLRGFLKRETTRQRRLARANGPIDFLTDILQFCDLLSLYLCCGATEEVEFPQSFGGRSIRLGRADAGEPACAWRLQPTPFAAGANLAVSARRWPPSAGAPRTRTFAFLLW